LQLPGDPAGTDVGQHVRWVGVHVVHGPIGGVHQVAVRHRRPVRPAGEYGVAGQGVRLYRSGWRVGGQRDGQQTQRGDHNIQSI